MTSLVENLKKPSSSHLLRTGKKISGDDPLLRRKHKKALKRCIEFLGLDIDGLEYAGVDPSPFDRKLSHLDDGPGFPSPELLLQCREVLKDRYRWEFDRVNAR